MTRMLLRLQRVKENDGHRLAQVEGLLAARNNHSTAMGSIELREKENISPTVDEQPPQNRI